MNNKEYIAELAQQTGYSQEDTQKLVRKAIDAMIVKEKLKNGGDEQ